MLPQLRTATLRPQRESSPPSVSNRRGSDRSFSKSAFPKFIKGTMPIQPCPDCTQPLSDQAASCPHCGYPQQDAQKENASPWRAAIKAKTPINVFALAMMACASIFGVSSTQLGEDSLEAFTYALHVFLAVSGMFFVCLLFCRSCIYHPDDLAKAKKYGLETPPDRPGIAAALIAVMLTGYTLYHWLG